jgi:proline dehydrogenase
VVRRFVTDHALGRQLAGRFIPGEGLEDVLAAARSLDGLGMRSILNHLGENVRTAGKAAEATDGYIRTLERIRESRNLGYAISIKPTQVGLDLSFKLCVANTERVLEVAASDPPILVMIDMEASAYADRTLNAYLALRERFSNVGVCVQANLHRTAADVERIGGPGSVVRVVKGAYLEPEEIAYQRRREVDRNFARVSATLLAAGSTVHLATHDPKLLEGARSFIRAHSISATRYEFQFLYGIRRDLQSGLVRDGEPVRIYIPYGEEWYPYLTRRLAERPANIWFFLSNLVRVRG